MALSSLTYTANGRGPYSFHGLDYLLVAHLGVTVNGTPVSATFDEGRREMTLAADPAAGATVIIQRTTPRRQEERLTQFLTLTDGNAGLTAALLDQDYRQNMLLNGEGRDLADSVPGLAGMSLNAGLQWDADGKRIETLAVASTPSSVVAKSQLDTVVAGARPLPTVGGGDNDDGLFVTAGEFDDQTPAQCRTHLALGTAAVLNTGTGANNIPVFSSHAPPQYPTVDGRNIDLTSHAIHTEIAKRSLATIVYLFTIAGITANNIDPTVATWSQSSSSRVGSLSAPWTARVELNNSSDVSGAFTPQVFTFAAGTWRIRYVARVRGPSGLFDPWSFRITNDDDTSSQTIHYDSGVLRILKQPGGSNIFAVYSDEVVIANASQFKLVFRWAEPNVLGNAMHLRLLFHKISTSSSFA